jgi:ribonuclease-3
VSEAEEAAAVLAPLEGALGYRFRNRELLENALNHSSFAHDHGDVHNNERLEFLGDSVVGLVVAHALYEAKPEWNEGELTRALHALVEGRSLAALARKLDLGALLRLGRTERQSGGEEKDSILADAMEAVIGAMYLDGGLESVKPFVERVFGEALHAAAPAVARDPKTELQERAMASRGEFPTYRLLRDSAIEGDDERFAVEVVLCGEALASGIGRTKRAAERRAASVALEGWVDDDPVEA